MSCDVEISIFGKFSDPEAVWELAGDAAAEGRINYLEEFDRERFLSLIEDAARDGRAIVLTRGRTTDFFEGVTASCQEAGLSYVVRCGVAAGDQFSSGFAWRPGMDREFGFLLNGSKPALEVSEVRRAAAKGMDAVNALVENVTRNTEIGKVEVEQGFVEAYREYAGTDAVPGAVR